MRTSRGELLVGVLVSAGAVALVTIVIALLRPVVPVLSLGVLYVFAVLPVAVGWGLAFAVPVSLASMLAFNWFFLPPTHTFALRDGANWLALAVYLVTAVVVSALATRARRRAAEAEQRERETALLATVSNELLQGVEVEDELERIGVLTAQVLGVRDASIELGQPELRAQAYPLETGARVVGRVVVPPGTEPDPEIRRRFLPALASVLAIAIDRAALAQEAVEAEALRRSDSAKTAVLRAVSHDLRSPLTAIAAAASGLSSGELELSDEDRRALLETIRSESARLDRVVGNLLDLSRLQAGVAAPQPELWTADELVAQALEEIPDGQERIDVELDGAFTPVRVDAGQIQRVLANLLENALRFAPPRSRVRLLAESGDGELKIHVRDDGPGIPAADRERVFDPFLSGENGGGAGLGLAIARGFAEANGARVWAEPSEGGAHLILALPAHAGAPVGA